MLTYFGAVYEEQLVERLLEATLLCSLRTHSETSGVDVAICMSDYSRNLNRVVDALTRSGSSGVLIVGEKKCVDELSCADEQKSAIQVLHPPASDINDLRKVVALLDSGEVSFSVAPCTVCVHAARGLCACD